MTFWGGLTSLGSDALSGKLVYLAINLVLVFVGAVLIRRALTVSGAIGIATAPARSLTAGCRETAFGVASPELPGAARDLALSPINAADRRGMHRFGDGVKRGAPWPGGAWERRRRRAMARPRSHGQIGARRT